MALDFADNPRKNKAMNLEEGDGFYAAWREQGTEANALRETGAVPPEKLLQAVWQHQRIRRGDLRTEDGRSLRIFHPGFASAEGGPDFRGAVVKIGEDAPVSGDVEVDLLPGDEAAERARKFIEDFGWQDKSFIISAIDGKGCRELTYAIMEHLQEAGSRIED